jgi:hypothetical protein
MSTKIIETTETTETTETKRAEDVKIGEVVKDSSFAPESAADAVVVRVVVRVVVSSGIDGADSETLKKLKALLLSLDD